MAEHEHGERFALMWYACKCGHRERIWNSRNGVTPFGLLCPSCGEVSLQHVDWHSDERKPDHSPHPGQRYFENGTADDAVAAIEWRIQIFADRDQPMPDDIAASLLDDARNQTGEWLPGWPTVRRA